MNLKIKKMRMFFCFIVISLCLSACDINKIYENNVVLPSEGWQRLERAIFEVNITDTVTAGNIYINVRNNNNYKYMQLWLFVDIRTPSGIVERDTVEIMLADHRGKWLGHGLGSKFDTRIFFRRNVFFPAKGKYIFEYEHAMRNDPIIGIDDIGLRIEKINE